MKKKRKKVSRLRRLRVSAQSASASVALVERSKVSAQSASASVAALERAELSLLMRLRRGRQIARLRRLEGEGAGAARRDSKEQYIVELVTERGRGVA